MSTQDLPVIVIGAGPIGLAAAAHLLQRGIEPRVLEAGAIGEALSQWRQVRMFSPWEFNLDPVSAGMLAQSGWTAPPAAAFPTGGELRERYLLPLATLPALQSRILTGARVESVSRRGRDRLKSAGREQQPFLVRYRQQGALHEVLARAVIDASGTFGQPNPLGASGLPALGEPELQQYIDYGLPDVGGEARERYRGRRVLVVGGGHSAFNMLLDLIEVEGTQVHWAVRRPSLARIFGGGENDQLQERGRLGLRLRQQVEAGRIRLHTGVEIERLRQTAAGLVAEGPHGALPEVDRVVVCAGFRPQLEMLSELRLGLDPATESPLALAPLIDPNVHSCGTVRPHGAAELAHPEPGLFIVGMKSYGRAPTFLLRTGYEQVRSVVAALAGDHAAAARVDWVLPETGVCSSDWLEAPADTTLPAASCASACTPPQEAPLQRCCLRAA